MKTPRIFQPSSTAIALGLVAGAIALAIVVSPSSVRADETCSSPYLARIEGQEEFVYVWTLGVEGLGDGADKLVTVDVKPGSPNYGKVIHSDSVGGRHEAHHGGFTDDRRQLWLAGLETSQIFIFDVHSDPAKPKLVKTIDNFEKATRRRGRTARRLCAAGARAHSVSLEREGQGRSHRAGRIQQRRQLHRHALAADEGDARGVAGAEFADGYGYDARVLPRKNALLTSSFTGWKNYMRDFGDLT